MTTIIKADGTTASGRDIQAVAFNFANMGDQASNYLDQVRQQAVEIVAQANQQADGIRRRAAQQGRHAAIEAVEKMLDEKVARQMQTLLPAIRKVVEAVRHAKQDWLRHWEKRAVHVASAIAARIIRRELTQTPEITLDLVTEALELAAGSGHITLQLHPDDHQALADQIRQLAAELQKLAPTEIVADSEITPGGCRIDTQFGTIDQQFEAQLARIEEELV